MDAAQPIPFCDNALCDCHLVAFDGKSVRRIDKNGQKTVIERYSYYAHPTHGRLDFTKMIAVCGTCRAAINLWKALNAGHGGRVAEN